MLFNEQEMLNVCKKYGIDVIEKDGYPMFNNEEMDLDFSMRDIMNDTCDAKIQEKTLYSKTMDLKISIEFESNDFTNCSSNSIEKTYSISLGKNECYNSEESILSNSSIISKAA